MATNSKIKKTTNIAENTEEKESGGIQKEHEEKKQNYRVKKDLDPHMIVPVKNGFNGTLVCKGKNGERYMWAIFGDEQEIELSDLKYIKNTYKNFFINNWFLFDDPEIIEYLGMTQYYKHALNSESFDTIFEKEPEEVKAVVKELSAGQKKSLAFRAKQMIASGDIDSMKVISALEESLGIELIEH